MSITSSKVINLVDSCFEGALRIIFRGHYPLQPVFIEKALEKSIGEHTKVFKNGILPPNKLTVLMHEEDFGDYKRIEGIYLRQLEKTVKDVVENSFQEHSVVLCKPAVFVTVDDSVPKGTVAIRAEHDERAYEEKK